MGPKLGAKMVQKNAAKVRIQKTKNEMDLRNDETLVIGDNEYQNRKGVQSTFDYLNTPDSDMKSKTRLMSGVI